MFGALRIPGTILFGNGQRHVIGAAAARLGRRALVCTDSRLSKTLAFSELLDDLHANGVETHVFDRTIADLPLDCIADCISSFRGLEPELIIGIGGGSCMDLAKVAAVL